MARALTPRCMLKIEKYLVFPSYWENSLLRPCLQVAKAKFSRVRKEFEELNRDFPEVDLYVQKKGYFDNSVCVTAANDLVDSFPPEGEYLVCLDNLKGHCCPEYQSILRNDGNALIIYTPPNCTDVCAVTDAGLGRSIKMLMRKYFQEHFENNLERWTQGTVTPKGKTSVVLYVVTRRND